MHRFLIGDGGLASHAGDRLCMALSAGDGNVETRGVRFRVCRWQNLVHVAVATLAIRAFPSARSKSLGVIAERVFLGFFGMTGRANRFGKIAIVRNTFDIGMTVYAGKDGTMH